MNPGYFYLLLFVLLTLTKSNGNGERYFIERNNSTKYVINMKKHLSLLLILSTLLFSAFTTSNRSKSFNTNSWSVSIGKTDLLCQTKNRIGDEIVIAKKSLKATQVLHARMYFCGQSADNATATLTIKNNFNKTLKEYSKQSYGLEFGADAPLKDFIEEFLPGQTIKIYFSISGAENEGLNTTVLLGQIKLK
jgi:hypothetical protein